MITKVNIVAAGKSIIWRPIHSVYDNIQLIGQDRIDTVRMAQNLDSSSKIQ